jgi:hypothetical protein
MKQTVIIGVGQLRNRSTKEEDAHEPADLIAEAIMLALADTGAGDAARAAVDALDVVNVMSWLYDALPGELAERAGITPQRKHHSEVGGNQPPLGR